MPLQPEQELIARAVAGERQAFRQLVEGYQGFLYAVAYRYMSNEAEAEDAVQETFIKLWKNLPKYRPEIKLTTWMYRILVNHCLDLKKTHVSRYRQYQVSTEMAVNFSTGSTPHTEMEGRELEATLQRATDQLSGKQKMIYVLRDMEGMEVHEVCALVGLNEDQVKSNLYHARKKVQEWIRKNYQ
ncbi:MAG: RNA polymerase sigma factor [Cyclobacteriaceae bacterium]